ncbi:nicotinamide-nucleotide amidohydrolase family protein [Paracoccus sp. S-4012]|uniref:CinA family protein n=1 Tax=Paracoccus sp. S-4012 TaxID=2665648 RepID=UPI0012AF153C|nr:CinA family protein [Paracoccus sp. S-4012]MRX51158.1 nicotinamide-nucleotide amidohydrolase family protein [Paracoccus sp. S-4012]
MKSVEDILSAARERKVKIALAESCTGGLLAAALTGVPGSSAVLERGWVTYSNSAKEEMLGVRPASIAAHGAVSEEVAAEMAQGALSRSPAGLALSITGIAGPGGSEHKPEGRVCFALATPAGVSTETVEFGAIGRDAVRASSVVHALGLITAELARMAVPPTAE